MILSCKEVTRLVSQGLDRRLGAAERARLRLHFLVCRGCRQAERQLAFLRQAMVRLARDELPGKS